MLASDDDADVALIRIKTNGLRPIGWATNEVAEGQWAVTPGLADTPQAVGVISTLPHKIEIQRALMGAQLDALQRLADGNILPATGPTGRDGTGVI